MAEPGPDSSTDTAADPATDPLVRTPQQERSRRTLRRILDAGLDLLREEGPDALTVTGITRHADTSVGSFYARFQGKDDLLRYLGERALADTESAWDALRVELPDGGGLRGRVTAVVQSLGRLFLDGPGRGLALLDGIEDPAPTRRRRLEDRIAQELQSLWDASELRIDLGARILMGTLHDAVLRAPASPPNGRSDGPSGSDEESAAASPYPPSDRLAVELVELLVGYLGGEVHEPAAPPDAAMAERPSEDAESGDASELVEADEVASDHPTDAPAAGETTEVPPVDDPDPFDIWA